MLCSQDRGLGLRPQGRADGRDRRPTQNQEAVHQCSLVLTSPNLHSTSPSKEW